MKTKMKKSQKAVLTVLGVLAGLIVVNVGLFASSDGADQYDSRGATPVEGELSGFNQIDISGNWQVNITQGDDWQVQWSESDRNEIIDVYVKGDTLKLKSRNSGRWLEQIFDSNYSVITAEIIMPALEEIELAGGGKIDMSGFDGDKLEIEIAGAAELRGSDGHYDRLELELAGASEIDLRGIVVKGAKVELAGASDVTLTLDGGKLSGEMAGAGVIKYYGHVSDDKVKIAGVGRVERME